MYVKTYRICKHCSKDIVSSRHNDHELKCLVLQSNRSRAKKTVGRPKGIAAWNKGLTNKTDSRVAKTSLAVSMNIQKRIIEGTYVPAKMSTEARERLSVRQSLHNTGGKSKWFDVAGQKVQGTYEKQFAESLQNSNMEWVKIKTNNHVFRYTNGDKIRSYAPDFYLPELDLYVEIKGFWWGNDKHKMELIRKQHGDKLLLVVFGKNELDRICCNLQDLSLEPVWSWR